MKQFDLDKAIVGQKFQHGARTSKHFAHAPESEYPVWVWWDNDDKVSAYSLEHAENFFTMLPEKNIWYFNVYPKPEMAMYSRTSLEETREARCIGCIGIAKLTYTEGQELKIEIIETFFK